MSEEQIMRNSLRHRKFEALVSRIGESNAPDTGVEDNGGFHPPKKLEALYGDVCLHKNEKERKLLSRLYDNTATELWQRQLNIPAGTGVVRTYTRLESAIQGISEYHFTSELTRQALLGLARAKLEEIAKSDAVQLAGALNVPDSMKGNSHYDQLERLKSFYDFVRRINNEEDRKDLSEMYDDKATELWKEKIDSADRAVQDLGLERTGYLQELDAAINSFPFFHKETPDAVLDYLLQRKKAGNE